MPDVTLRPVDATNEEALRAPRVLPGQEAFVATNAWSLAEAASEEHAWMRAICADGVPVGFILMYVEPEKGIYYIWRYMIDGAQQGRGYGRRAMELLIEHVCEQPNAKQITLEYTPGDDGPLGFYAKLGFAHTGREHDGAPEMRLALD